MLKPPFKLANTRSPSAEGRGGIGTYLPGACCEEDAASPAQATGPATRARLADLDPHLHCSVIGTCLSTAELRKLMARFLFVRDASDLDVHHEAVRLAARGGPVVKALHKALDQRHEPVVQRFSRAHEPEALATLWEEALRHGEIPGAYWALLTHRSVSADLRQKAFGDVHMLSHLVGAANRADIRRLVALERENGELRERGERQQLRSQESAEERERVIHELRVELSYATVDAEAMRAKLESSKLAGPDTLASAQTLVALQTERRERAEQAASVAAEEATRLKLELEHLAKHVQALDREVAAAEVQLREMGDAPTARGSALVRPLSGQRIFYVGGRPSSTPAIRDLVLRHGGEFQHHDGGLEDRKGLLSAGIGWAQLVVFPVDCIDHDSAGNLKRTCTRLGVDYLPLRSASVASFAAAIAQPSADNPPRPAGPECTKQA